MNDTGAMKRVLFVCIHNSARSQMAETYLNALGEGRYIAESAGLEPGSLNPYVVRVMEEEGYDISENETNSVFNFYNEGRRYDYVIAVCSRDAQERCPIFPGRAQHLHWPFPDPSSFHGEEAEKLAFTRKVREQIKAAVRGFIAGGPIRQQNGV
jgi:arsenate reductase